MNENTNISPDIEKVFEESQELTKPTNQVYVPQSATGATLDTGIRGESRISSQEVSDIVDQALDSPSPESARSEGVRTSVEQFNGLDVDQKLAVFYYLYEAMGESVTPAAPGAADLDLLKGFFDEFDALSPGDAQLEAMRALVRSDDNGLSREYGKHSENNKLAIWFLLAERMGKDVIDIPEDYKLSDVGQQNMVAVKQLDFEQQITFLRDIAAPMGIDSIQRAE